MRIFIFVILITSSHTIASFKYILEDFNHASYSKRWEQSRYGSKVYGKFMWTTGKLFVDPILDMGIQTVTDNANYAYSVRIKESFSNFNSTLIVQFQVKYEKNITCAGGYLKILPSSFNQLIFNKDSPFLIMFGPDRIYRNEMTVRAILQHRGQYYPIKKMVTSPIDTRTHLYTLIIRPNCVVEILIDHEVVFSGMIEDYWDIIEPMTIKDFSVKKPSTWVDDEYIDDPDDHKPETWDEVEKIPDPDIKKPNDWVDKFDGVWKQPFIENPNYRGKWSPRKIKNIKFTEKWTPPLKPNPNYISDQYLYKFDDIGGIGLDLWQVTSGTLFDNILVTTDEKYAKSFAEKMWRPLYNYETKQINKEQINMKYVQQSSNLN